MRGFVPTPEEVVDLMVEKLFRVQRPGPSTRILDPGCGRGAFIDGIIRWCGRHDMPLPRIIGVELDPSHVRFCRARFGKLPSVSIVRADFLTSPALAVDAVIGNPPYVSIEQLGAAEKAAYRRDFATAHGRFDLYALFFERALECLRPGGRLVFITPEKFIYVESSRALRRILSAYALEELQLIDESTFAGLVTYPVITTLEKTVATRATRVLNRRGETHLVGLHSHEESWLPLLRGHPEVLGGPTLGEICRRVSCGVATGADGVFVQRLESLPRELVPFAHRTIAGRELPLVGDPVARSAMLVPYDDTGRLLPEAELGALLGYLTFPGNFAKLIRRTCVKSKPWHAFHENPPLPEILRPKILCKDIGPRPAFVIDRRGDIVPRHSVYYIVPENPAILEPLLQYLNSQVAASWLEARCQRAANGFLRLQSTVLKRLPVPSQLSAAAATAQRRARSA